MRVYFSFLLSSPGVVSSMETAAEPESAGISAHQEEDVCQDPGMCFYYY